jgi:radical SAM superfamily enzyme YgiQ (UPF0313 family)
MKPIIYFTNLTHVSETGVIATETIPLNLGFLSAHVKKSLNGNVETELFNLPAELSEAVKRRKPHIIAASNYAWNSKISYFYLEYFKKMYPEIVTVMGGPTFSYRPEKRLSFMAERPHLDFYVSGEGEVAFSNLVGVLVDNGMRTDKVKKMAVPGTHAMVDGELISGEQPPRLKQLDSIPSPYLDGTLDKFLEHGFTPMIQSNRGCPFGCGYCCSGVEYYNKIGFFGVDRVVEELEYISKRVKSPTIHVHDDNFGMFNQDYEICRKFKEMQEKRKWPMFISAATGKNSKEKILKCIELVGSSLMFSASVQTMNKETQRIIGRDNISLDDFMVIQDKLKDCGANSFSEFILPLPAETRQSHLAGIKSVMEAGIDAIGPYTTMLLPASPLDEDDVFKQYGMVAKYRVIPRDFGRYEGEVVVEVEKVCVATNSLSLEDYFYLRGFHYISYCIYNGETFKELIAYLRGIGVGPYDFLLDLYENIGLASAPARRVMENFLAETHRELFDTEDEIYRRYREESNYEKLISQDEGANLIQKYNGRFFSKAFNPFMDYIFERAANIIAQVGKNPDPDILDSIHQYIKGGKSNIFEISSDEVVVLLSYDIHAWKAGKFIAPIQEMRKNVRLKFMQSPEQKKTLADYFDIYGMSDDSKGKILTRVNPKLLFMSATEG